MLSHPICITSTLTALKTCLQNNLLCADLDILTQLNSSNWPKASYKQDPLTQQLTKEAEHVLMKRRSETGIEQKAVAIGARLVAAVRRLYQDGDRAVLKLITHLGNRLTVSSATVVHTLTLQ